jgi:hypothetical protein
MSGALNLVAMAEAIGSTAPISDDDGVLRHSPSTAPTYNTALKNRKPTVEIDESFLAKHKENAQAGKSIVDLAEKIGGAGLDGSDIYNRDLDTVSAARNKAYKALTEAIQVLSESDIDYWCPDEATKQSAPKIKAILEKFASRLQ